MSNSEEMEYLSKNIALVRGEIAKAVVGYEYIVDDLLICLMSRGHILMEGVPGVAKTTLAKAFSSIMSLQYSRIQFTQDLLPADIIGHYYFNQKESRFDIRKGPVFSEIVLADEINRAPPKTQSALLEAMEERQATIEGTTFKLPPDFVVIATINPIEAEGVYSLPEAQLDRFFFQINIDYPSIDEEKKIIEQTTGSYKPELAKILSDSDILELQEIVRKVPVAEHVSDYAVKLARASRPKDPSAPDFVKQFVNWGAGPRAAQALILGAKARAILYGRYAASLEDVKAVAYTSLRHRILLNFHAEAEGITTSEIIRRLLDEIS